MRDKFNSQESVILQWVECEYSRHAEQVYINVFKSNVVKNKHEV